jgi:hypothetical protein
LLFSDFNILMATFFRDISELIVYKTLE